MEHSPIEVLREACRLHRALTPLVATIEGALGRLERGEAMTLDQAFGYVRPNVHQDTARRMCTLRDRAFWMYCRLTYQGVSVSGTKRPGEDKPIWERIAEHLGKAEARRRRLAEVRQRDIPAGRFPMMPPGEPVTARTIEEYVRSARREMPLRYLAQGRIPFHDLEPHFALHCLRKCLPAGAFEQYERYHLDRRGDGE